MARHLASRCWPIAASSQDVEVLNFSQPPEALPPAAQLPAEAAGLKPPGAAAAGAQSRRRLPPSPRAPADRLKPRQQLRADAEDDE